MSIENNFRSLAPNEYIDLNSYGEALDYVFSLDKIRNIALTGAYGSGKSSVIRSYEQVHKERTFIHISLAHFDEQGKSKIPAGNDSKVVNDLEGKIINQLIHQIPEKSIPQSHFQIKSELSAVTRLLIVIATLAFVALWIYVLKFHNWVLTISALPASFIKSILLITTNPYFRLIGVGLIILLAGIGLFHFLSSHSLQSIFKKVDLKGIIGFELFGAEEDTYFDKYLNKVLCLFDAADADAIVFEDLDRYDVTLIFEKLREINDLVYSRTKQGLRPKKKPLRFFYLIRDDIFTASDRSKFFDFIIPVVPYVDASNSCDQLLQRFDEAGLSNTFNKRFLQDVSLYLSDMRLITNIVNEYIVYHGRLSNSGLATQSDRQLAMVIYKNLYPGDFDLLHHGRGYVFALFEAKSILLENQRKEIDLSISELHQQMDSFDKECLKNMDELNALFFPLSEEILSIAGEQIGPLTRTDLVRRILQNPNDVYYRKQPSPYSSYSSSARFDTEAKKSEMESNSEYSQRKKVLESREVNSKKFLDDIKRLEEKKLRLSTFTAKELISQLDKETAEKFWNPILPSYESEGYVEIIQNSKSFNLLKYLIRNGYIDENYAAYVSYFYPNSLTVRDRNFLLALSDRTPLEYGYHINHPDAILDRLDASDFTRRELRNFDLLSYLLYHKCDAQLHIWLQACDGNEDAYQFFVQFWRLGNLKEELFHVLYTEQPLWFHMWCENGIIKGSEWKQFVLDIFAFLDNDQLQEINEDYWLTNRISNDHSFLMIDHPDISLLIQAFKVLDIQFTAIEYREQDIPLVKTICQENLYILNLPMLKLFMNIYWGVSNAEAESRSYSHILKNPDAALSQRVFNDIVGYVNVILHETTVRFFDDEKCANNLLNRNDLSEEYKLEYIQRMDTILADINSIETFSLWPTLIECCRLKYTWENIADYFAELEQSTGEISNELATFINSGTGDLDWNYDNLNSRIGNEKATILRRAVLSSKNISLERFRVALAGMTFEYSGGFPLADIPSERMKVIFELNIVPMTVENIEVVRKSYPQLWSDFVVSANPRALLKLIDSEVVTLTVEEVADLLEDSRIDVKTALELVNSYSEIIPTKNRDYPTSVKVKIIQEHFNPNEIPMVLQSFEQAHPQICMAFLKYAKEHVELTVSSAEHIQYIPVKVYSACLEEFTESQALVLRPYLSDKNFEIVCTENKKPQFSDTAETRKILKYFKEKNWISSYKLEKGCIRAFPTRK